METYNKSDHDGRHPSNRLVIGIVLVVAGFFLLLRNTNIIPVYITGILFSWQMLLIVIGLVITLSGSNKTPGIILMAIGGFFLIPELFYEIFGRYRIFWPALFIGAGILIIFAGQSAKRTIFSHTEGTSANDYLDIVNIFSGGDRKIISDNFRGGKVTSIFGGSKINLSKCRLTPGISQLDITCIFGGTEIIVPEDWSIVIDVVPILGGFSDDRKISAGSNIDSSKTLIIKGTVVFGGGEINCKYY